MLSEGSGTVFDVAFVVPVYNGAATLRDCLAAIRREAEGHRAEIILIDDNSTDGSRAIVDAMVDSGAVRCLEATGQGAAAAVNRGFAATTARWVAQVDQDVILHPGWLNSLLAALASHPAAAAQGRYLPDPTQPWIARVMALDLDQRYARLTAGPVNHVCTGNTVYARAPLAAAGLFNPSMPYGYDNDMSYRLAAAGHDLLFCPTATSTHVWRQSASAFVRQQFNVGLGRLRLVGQHPGRWSGDQVSGLGMVAHAGAMWLALLWLLAVGASAAWGVELPGGIWPTTTIVAALTLERLFAGLHAGIRRHDIAGLGFVPLHLLRDLAWAGAISMMLFAPRRTTAQARRRRTPAL